MRPIDSILTEISHRPFDLPSGRWRYYQEWNNALFFHWSIPIDSLQESVPEALTIDTFEGTCYVSLVAFTMEKIRPKLLPSLAFVSTFDEINVRTYIDINGKKGFYFLNIEAGKSLSTFLAKVLSGLPYEKSTIKRNPQSYHAENRKKGFSLGVEYDIKEAVQHKTALDKWLTERYCLYLDKGNDFYCYDIHHKEWELNDIEIKHLSVDYKMGKLDLGKRQPDSMHYSPGVGVVAWKRQDVKQ